MKKYRLYLLALAIGLGFVFSNLMFSEYSGRLDLVFAATDQAYFLKHSEHESLEDMKAATDDLNDFLYIVENDTYKVYLAISKSEENIKKLQDIFSELEIETSIEERLIFNVEFVTLITQFDALIAQVEDSNNLLQINKRVLQNYKEMEQIAT